MSHDSPPLARNAISTYDGEALRSIEWLAAELRYTEKKLQRSIDMEGAMLRLMMERKVTPGTAEICGALDKVASEREIVNAATALEFYLWQNTGSNDEWAIEIRTATDEGGKLAQLLGALRSAIKAAT